LFLRVSPELVCFLPNYYPQSRQQITGPLIQPGISPPGNLKQMLHDPEITQGIEVAPQPIETTPNTVQVMLSTQLIADLEATFTKIAEFMVVGRIKDKCLVPKRLTLWARYRLHRSFIRLSMRTNNFFEVQFLQEEGRAQTLMDKTYTYDGQIIIFYTWPSFFDSDIELQEDTFKIAL
jgi:hypothetical protein